MSRGGYLGGSTVIGPRSGWFSKGKPQRRKGKRGKGKQVATAYSAKSLILSEKEAQNRGLTRAEWLQRMRARSDDLRAEIARQQDAVLAADRKLKAELDRLDKLLKLQKMVQQADGKIYINRNGCTE